uniref:Uncharacterized protein n=1 Tax=Siphoviridae sp. ctr2f5 TaxID=2825684 RepID=A0A8S5QE76_9CAUD|nr:MAG TPA: hypothetical protein [Siphoviridae sp. ctr2f5]
MYLFLPYVNFAPFLFQIYFLFIIVVSFMR